MVLQLDSGQTLWLDINPLWFLFPILFSLLLIVVSLFLDWLCVSPLRWIGISILDIIQRPWEFYKTSSISRRISLSFESLYRDWLITKSNIFSLKSFSYTLSPSSPLSFPYRLLWWPVATSRSNLFGTLLGALCSADRLQKMFPHISLPAFGSFAICAH